MWESGTRDTKYLEILSLFADEPTAPLSIHQFASTGAEDGGKAVGQWYGPNTVAHVVRRLLPRLPSSSSARLRAHVVMDNLLVAEDVDEDEASWTPLVLFVPLRLGLSEINPVYVPGLKACFGAPENVALGVIGGTPNHALYFVGCVGDELIYLDPHTTQQAVDVILDADADATYHCSSPKRMNILQIDPSLAAVCILKILLFFSFCSLCSDLCSTPRSPIIGQCP
jgi:cysteine protease ATG4